MTLYELSQKYLDFLSFIESEEGEMLPDEAVKDTLESIQEAIEDKMDNIACLYKNLSAEAEAIKAEEKRLETRRKSKENTCKRLKNYLYSAMLSTGKKKLETPRSALSFRTSRSVEVEDGFLAWAKETGREDLLVQQEPKANKTEIGVLLKTGEVIPGAQLVERQNLQIK
ncbi:siphovirus Gp157 family protein [Christensenellaceae bacterium 44-20]